MTDAPRASRSVFTWSTALVIALFPSVSVLGLVNPLTELCSAASSEHAASVPDVPLVGAVEVEELDVVDELDLQLSFELHPTSATTRQAAAPATTRLSFSMTSLGSRP